MITIFGYFSQYARTFYFTDDFENNKYGILQNISIHLEEHCVEMYPGSGMMEKCKIFHSTLLYDI